VVDDPDVPLPVIHHVSAITILIANQLVENMDDIPLLSKSRLVGSRHLLLVRLFSSIITSSTHQLKTRAAHCIFDRRRGHHVLDPQHPRQLQAAILNS
jgi:hypothetical protein